jgi:N4-gp56 family major capsid protein
MIENLINPQVVGDMVNAALAKQVKMTPFVKVDTTLVAQPGSKITLGKWGYIGDAEVITEGDTVTAAALQTTKVDFEVKKFAKAVELTDEEILSGYGDPVGQAANQVVLSIASKIDAEVAAQFETANLVADHSTEALDATVIAKALKFFGENDEDKVLFVHPDKYADLLALCSDFVKASQYANDILYTGEIGQIYGMRVVKTTRLTVNDGVYTSVIAVPGAVTLFMKQAATVEQARDELAFKNYIIASQHAVAALTDATKVVKILSI